LRKRDGIADAPAAGKDSSASGPARGRGPGGATEPGAASGRLPKAPDATSRRQEQGGKPMNQIIYLVGLVVVVLFILSVLGLR